MGRILLVVAVLIGLVALGVGRTRPGSALRDRLETAGCSGTAVEHQRSAHRSVWSVSVRECVGEDGVLVSADRAVDVMGSAAWSSPSPRFDLLYVTVYRTAESPQLFQRTFSREVTTAELAARWGSREAGLDQGDGPSMAVRQIGWVVLPFVGVGMLVFAGWAGVRSARSGIVVIRFPG